MCPATTFIVKFTHFFRSWLAKGDTNIDINDDDSSCDVDNVDDFDDNNSSDDDDNDNNDENNKKSNKPFMKIQLCFEIDLTKLQSGSVLFPFELAIFSIIREIPHLSVYQPKWQSV